MLFCCFYWSPVKHGPSPSIAPICYDEHEDICSLVLKIKWACLNGICCLISLLFCFFRVLLGHLHNSSTHTHSNQLVKLQKEAVVFSNDLRKQCDAWEPSSKQHQTSVPKETYLSSGSRENGTVQNNNISYCLRGPVPSSQRLSHIMTTVGDLH